jgi:uncharacterized protein YeeX (DUF496 family)
MAIIINRRNSRKLRENSHTIFVLANASGYISSLVNILELIEKYQFGTVVDNVDNRVSKKDLSMEECQQMVK